MAYFPMFIELAAKRCLVVGGGKVAYRKVKVLRDFGAQITVIAPEILSGIKELQDVTFYEKECALSELHSFDVVVAATDDKEWNHRIAEACRQEKIPVNAVDQIEDCDFIFPAYLKQGDVVAAFSSGGKCPVIAQHLKAQTRPIMTEHLGALADCLGELREHVKDCVATEAERKQVYQELLELGLRSEEIPTAEEIGTIIAKYARQKAE